MIRYVIKTARGYFRAERHSRPGADPHWTRYPEEAQEWVDLASCHKACRQYTEATGESAVVVVHAFTSATSDTALPKSA